MTKIKLKEWADRNNLSYLTANRHFHAGMIPGASQLDSGTILVEDDSPEQTMPVNSSNDAMSLFLKKTVEYSKNNSSVEDFAAYVISNFTLKLSNVSEPSPRYSKNRPKSEEVQKHFQQFLPDKEKQEHLKAIKDLVGKKAAVTEGLLPDGVINEPSPFVRGNPEPTAMDEEYEDMGKELLAYAPQILDHMYGPDTNTTGGLVNRSVDFDTTPQQVNYTGSNSPVFSSIGAGSSISDYGTVCGGFVNNSSSDAAWLAENSTPGMGEMNAIYYYNNPAPAVASVTFQPTQKELLSSDQVIEINETDDAPRGKRGRKPSIKKR